MQTGLPMTALSVAGAQYRLPPSDRAVLTRDFLPWALRAGTRSTDLMCLYYEEHFDVRRSHLPHLMKPLYEDRMAGVCPQLARFGIGVIMSCVARRWCVQRSEVLCHSVSRWHALATCREDAMQKESYFFTQCRMIWRSCG